MRKHRMLHFLPALSLAAVLAAGVIPAARAAAPDSTPGVLTGQNSGFYSQITDLEGTVSRYDGVPDPSALENSPMVESIASYAVYAPDGTLVLETQLHDIQGPVNTIADGVPMPQGYYSVEFCLSETDNTYVYLTGLTSDNLDQVQQAMMDAVMEHSQFIMEDLDFIDAEKVSQPQDNDDLLCWAASTSNMLHYTGWAAAAAQEQPGLSAAYHGLQTTDDVFDLFVDSFTDEASNPLYGTEWFFNAVSSVQSLEDWSQVLDYGVSGGYLPDYSAWNVLRHIPVSYDHTRINQAMDSLRSGSGLAITLGWLNADGERDGGHSITVWGYIWDEDYQRDELRYYQALIVADSDSDMLPEGDRREAPNRLRVLNMEPLTSHGYQTWTFDGYYTLNCLEEFIALAPYSPDIPREGSLGGSRDLFADPDLSVDFLYVSTSPMGGVLSTVAQGELVEVSADDTLYLIPQFTNHSPVDISAPFSYGVTVDGQQFQGSTDVGLSGFYTSYPDEVGQLALSGLEPGTYELTFTANPDRSPAEAYYSNNTYRFQLRVTASSREAALTLDGEAGTFTDLEYGALSLAQGEDISFSVVDASDAPHAPAPWLVQVYAAAQGRDPVLLFTQEGTCRESGDRFSVRFSSWQTPLTDGIYQLTAVLTYDGGQAELALGKVTVEKSPMPFTDVTLADWFYDEVQYVWAHNLMVGTSDTTFDPGAQLTRCMMWTILARMDGETIAGANWAQDARAWAMDNGVSDGTDADRAVAREELVTMLWRYVGKPAGTGDLSGFADANTVSGWAKDAMSWSVGTGLIQGDENGLTPAATATRGQIAAILTRYCQMELPPSGDEAWDNIPFAQGQLYAVAHLGYQQMDSLPRYVQTYLEGSQPPVYRISDGDYYLIIPRYTGMELSLYRIDTTTSQYSLVRREADCQPFVLQCNASDLLCDAAIRLTYQGQSVEFSPYISLKDGSVVVGEYGLDLTLDSEG